MSQEPAGLHFTINPVTGRITTAAELDHEFTETFTLRVAATDGAPPHHRAEKTVTISVTDTNDNAPEFNGVTAIAVPEDTPPNSPVGVVQARDPDANANGRLRYELINAAGTFTIDSNTGELTLRESLSGRNRVFDLTIRATDQGSQRRSATTKVMLFTTTASTSGSSNAGPTFTQTRYNAEVRENEPAGTPVGQVTARYPSAGVTSNLAYYLTGVSASDGAAIPGRLFRVQPTTGTITTTQPLDREYGNGFGSFILDIWVIDQDSSGPKTTKTQVGTLLFSSPGHVAGGHWARSDSSFIVFGFRTRMADNFEFMYQGCDLLSWCCGGFNCSFMSELSNKGDHFIRPENGSRQEPNLGGCDFVKSVDMATESLKTREKMQSQNG